MRHITKILPIFICLWICGSSALLATQYHVAIKGDDGADGSLSRPFRTISHVAGLAIASDVITVHAGVYRELVSPLHGGLSDRQRVIYRAARGEKVTIKGSELVKGWKRTDAKGTWEIRLPDSYFGAYNPYKELIYGDWFFPIRPLHTGEVFINGRALQEHVGWRCKSLDDSTLIAADFGNLDPNLQEVEITVRPACFYPAKTGVDYITVRGFTMSQAATQWAAPTAEQVGLIGTNWSKGWIIEDNVVSDSKCVGIALGKDRTSGHNVWSADMEKDGSVLYNQVIERAIASGWNRENIGSHVVRNNTVFNCGAAGICGSLGAIYSSITGNHIYNIYVNRNFYGAEMAGIKIHGAVDVLVSGNRVHDAFIGLWLDWMAQGTRVIGNTFEGNDYCDLFMEVNHGPYLVKGNRFLSAFSLRDWSEGGTYRNNYFAGVVSRAPQERATPVFKPHSTELIELRPVTGGRNRFYGNIFEGPAGTLPVRPKMHAEDKEDKLTCYGLAIYKDAAIPVKAKRNEFKGRARPFIKQKQITNKN